MRKWYAGIDAGGTKTQVRLIFKDGDRATFAGNGVGGPGNLQDVGEQGMVDVIREAVEAASQDAGLSQVPDLAALTIGAAGISRRIDAEQVHAALSKVFPQTAVSVYNDGVIALAGGAFGEPGIVIIAGTGSTVWTLAGDGSWHRVGGWGYILGDEGSGYWIGHKALAQIVRSSDGREPKTSLREAVFSELGFEDVTDIIPFLHGRIVPKQKVGRLAPIVLSEAEAGDRVAKAIVDEALDHLLDLIAPASKLNLPSPTPLVIVGGLFKNERFLKTFINRVRDDYPGITPVLPTFDPAGGACVLAMKQTNDFDESIRHSLIESYKA